MSEESVINFQLSPEVEANLIRLLADEWIETLSSVKDYKESRYISEADDCRECIDAFIKFVKNKEIERLDEYVLVKAVP